MMKRIIFASIIILLYCVAVEVVLTSGKTVHLLMAGKTTTSLEIFCLPYWFTKASMLGVYSKRSYSHRIGVVIEYDRTPLLLSNFDFYYFYSGYKDGLIYRGSSSGISLYPCKAYDDGRDMGCNAFQRVLRHRLKIRGISGYGLEEYNGAMVVTGSVVTHREMNMEIRRMKLALTNR